MNKPLKLLLVAGARPNFMKIAPVIHAVRAHNAACDGNGNGNGNSRKVQFRLVHTGQHYDEKMSGVFFEELGIPTPDDNLEIGSGSHAVQTAQIMLGFEPVCLREKPDWVVVVGDVNSTLACTLVAAKLGIPVAHIEAGLRSFDRGMPEELNRIVTDALADLLLTPSADGDDNLRREGAEEDKIRCVGNVMIDSLVAQLNQADATDTMDRLGLESGRFVYVTLHRPSNVDFRENLEVIVDSLIELSEKWPVVFPLHPRTRGRMAEFGLSFDGHPGLRTLEPLGYHDSLNLTRHARFLLTDSGGLQEESTYFRTPCLTLRPNTERPVTITVGSNRLTSVATLSEDITRLLAEPERLGETPPLWDGCAADRIVEELLKPLPAFQQRPLKARLTALAPLLWRHARAVNCAPPPRAGLFMLFALALWTDRVQGEISMAASAGTLVDTRAIELTAPASGSVNASPVNVTFFLPRNALANTLKLGFSGSVTRELSLSSALEWAGTHSLTFDSGNPTASAAIASGEGIPDGVYTVKLSYQDPTGDVLGSNSSPLVTIDRTAPVLVVPADILVAATGDTGAVVGYPSATASDALGVANLSYSHASGTTFPIGVTRVVVTARDAAGNSAVASFAVTVNGTQISVEQPPGVDLTDSGVLPVDFGIVVAGSSKSLGFLIRNPGTTDLTGLAVTTALTGNPGEFTLDAPVSATLAPNSTAPFTMTFSPMAAGVRSATLLIASSDPDENPFEIHLSGRQATPLEAWRVAYFGSPSGSGQGADLADSDADGIVNLLEFATAGNPTERSPSPVRLSKSGDVIEFSYSRSTAALQELRYTVETAASPAGPWAPAEPSASVVVSDNGLLQEVKTTVSTTAQAAGFFRLRVSLP